MIFDRNKRDFLSELHQNISDTAIYIIPPEIAITPALKEKFSGKFINECYTYHSFLIDFLTDMYENCYEYKSTYEELHRFYLEFFLLTGQKGVISNDKLILTKAAYKSCVNRLFTAKIYAKAELVDKANKISREERLSLLSRTGLQISENGDNIELMNPRYPGIMNVIAEMAKASKNNDDCGHKCFTRNNYRQLVKGKMYDFDDFVRICDDGGKRILLELYDFAKENKIKFDLYRFGTLRFKNAFSIEPFNNLKNDKTCIVFHINFANIRPGEDNSAEFFSRVEKQCPECIPFLQQSLKICRRCSSCCGKEEDVFGKKIFHCIPYQIKTLVKEQDIDTLIKLIKVRLSIFAS